MSIIWVPIDAKLVSDRDVSFEAVPLEQVLQAVDGARKLRPPCSTPAATIRS